MRRPFPKKRIYKSARVAPQAGAFVVMLDDEALRTPGGASLAAPTLPLGEAIAAEWAGAGERIDVAALALTRLAMTAIDAGGDSRLPWTEEILKFAGSDLLCYRATEPIALVRRQSDLWTPCLDWAASALGARFAVTSGVVAVAQPAQALDAIAARLAALDPWRLLGVRRATEILGSAVLALALEADAFPPTDILAAARLDENFQAERWGWDAEAAAREARIEKEINDVARFLALLKS